MASTDTQLIKTRAETVAKSWSTADVKYILSLYSDTEMEFSDYAMGVSNVDRAGFTKVAEETFAAWRDIKFTFNNTYGPSADGVVTLETTVSFTANADVKPLVGKNQTLEMPAVMLMKFDQEGKVVMQHDYHCIPMALIMKAGGGDGQ